ncbi:hypothetical protein GCM10010145_11480 [Streptomyces ruber]|uniref:Type VII secretion system-associated protein n=2 Tax=Streptomyces TaxID=1883 RepID=A0A918EQP3_9ACTN|nr:type VII secretion system-associated protein [Streptomyces ruber]GGQ44512.1 hypothetical protein GCM10010145_11480 [Streptomyces ruber]
MAGEQADVRHFDLKQMENFRDNEVHPAYTAAKEYREEEKDGIRPLDHLIRGYITPENDDKNAQILRIGPMISKSDVSGPELIEEIKAAATAIDKLLGDQIDLFKELKEALTETIEEANKTKEKNIDAIDAQTLLTTLEEVDTLIAGSSGGTTNKP